MNYLDMVGENDPKSWHNTMGTKPPPFFLLQFHYFCSLPGSKHRDSSNGGRQVRRREELQSKRSRGGGGGGGARLGGGIGGGILTSVSHGSDGDPRGPTRSLQLLEAIDALVARIEETYGQEAVCANSVVTR